MDQRKRRQARYVAASVEKTLGALPVVADYCRRLDLAGIIDRAAPIRELADLTHGQVIETLIANRLTSPAPLVRVSDWAREWAVADVFGVDPDLLNDDRIGRALDAIAPQLDHIIGSVGAQAISTFGIDVSRLHWDMTSVSLYGAYEQTEDDYPAPKFGHPKDRRVDLKQIQAGLAVTGDGGIPVFHRAYDGGAGEVTQVVGAMTALRKMSAPRDFLLIGDSKLVSYTNVSAMIASGAEFIAPASKNYVPADVLGALDLNSATVVDYTAERDTAKPAAERGTWRVIEDTMALTGKRKKDPVHTLRRVFVHSTARATAAATARVKKLDRATGDLDRLTRGLGSRHYPDEKAVTARITAIRSARRVSAYLQTQAGTDPDTGKPTLAWSFDQAALDTEAATDGWYALLTNLGPATADASEVLIRYKGQEVVERRYSTVKGPLAVAPMFLKNNRRITALVTVICLALLIFCLIERQVRQAIAPAVTLDGLYVGRPAKPTGRLIFEALARLRMIPATPDQPAGIPHPPPLLEQLLELLDVDPTRPR
ncbi:IS1634 family transposase [Amycolatopsis balhimycina DSM 5908]|uniref:IS1634 family transposase n=1 Tax=Amycolatopsis balhimycina DSM 5908 TaxID=1081091 RepID=A0A428VU48_AMYBA|nr:IS1634 family transposase [Amycolatopsis balhimycina]RSM34355.1 IS1634 family transposase [Amycolatopsis balhimycina DSM 5908]